MTGIDALVWRETDARRLNVVVNDPDVRPCIDEFGEGHLDLSAHVANPSNVLLMGEHGGCMFFGIAPGVFEVHTQVLRSGRGGWVRDFVQAVVHWMFTRTAAYEIVTRIPARHRGAVRAAEWAGLRFQYRLPAATCFCGQVDDVLVYALRIQDWVLSAPRIEEIGQMFHQDLIFEAARAGITEPAHVDAPAHNRFVGAALEMVRNGQLSKGFLLYNLSAVVMRKPQIGVAFAGEPPVMPPVIRMDLGDLRILPDRVELMERRDVAA